MRIKIVLLLLSALLLQNLVSAQNSDNGVEERYKHAIGFGAGFTTAYGISYRFFPGSFGAQATFAPYKDGEDVRISTGLTFLYRIIESEKLNLLLYEGNHYYYDRYQHEYYDYFSNTFYEETSTDEFLNIGVGFGVEFIIAEHFSFNLMGGYAGYDGFRRIGLTGETGIFYTF